MLYTCLWKEIISQQRIRHFKILQSIYFAYDVGIISSYSDRINALHLVELQFHEPGKSLVDLHYRTASTMLFFIIILLFVHFSWA